ncbi:MAG TPA: 1-phosphofructokinase [Longimicrobium sp.]|nr:1-phosphofructokinase [Longimicrobium sp.]
MEDARYAVVTVTPNPAIDWTLTVPDFAAGAVNRVAEQRSAAAGKGVNVAAALAAHGRRVAATGFLGTENAAPFEALFARAGIGDGFVRVPGETRVGVKIVDPARGETTDVNFPGLAPSADDVAALRERVAALAAACPGAWFVLAGSLPPGVDPALYRELTGRLRGAGARVALDTSGEPLRHALAARPHLVKPNADELAAITGRALPDVDAVAAAARELVAGGVELAVISMGARGAVFVRAGEAVLARPPRVPVGSTVGAGDAMVAGTVAALLAGLPLPEVARLASAFSLAALTRGAPGPATRAEVEAAAARIEVEPLADRLP